MNLPRPVRNWLHRRYCRAQTGDLLVECQDGPVIPDWYEDWLHGRWGPERREVLSDAGLPQPPEGYVQGEPDDPEDMLGSSLEGLEEWEGATTTAGGYVYRWDSKAGVLCKDSSKCCPASYVKSSTGATAA